MSSSKVIKYIPGKIPTRLIGTDIKAVCHPLDPSYSNSIRPITNINIYGLTFYYNEENNKVGFPEWYNYDSRHLDPRVGHQNWIDKEIAEAIVYRVIELRDAFKERQNMNIGGVLDEEVLLK